MGCDRLPILLDVLCLCTPAGLLLVVRAVPSLRLEVECGVVVLQWVDVSGSIADGICATAASGNQSCALPTGHGNLTSFVHFLAGIGILLRSSPELPLLESVPRCPSLRRPLPYTPHIHIISVCLGRFRVSCCAAITRMPNARS